MPPATIRTRAPRRTGCRGGSSRVARSRMRTSWSGTRSDSTTFPGPRTGRSCPSLASASRSSHSASSTRTPRSTSRRPKPMRPRRPVTRSAASGRARRTALVYHERFLWHDAGAAASVIPAGEMVEPGPHAESPERIRRINSLIEVSGLGELVDRLRPRPATLDEVLRFHTEEYVRRVQELSDGAGGEAGESAPVNRSSYEIALLSAGASLAAGGTRLGG